MAVDTQTLTQQQLRIVDEVRRISPSVATWVHIQFKYGSTREAILAKLELIRTEIKR